MEFKNLKIGQKAELSLSFSKDDVLIFAELTKDKNPIHLDETYASGTIFKKPIVHGMLYSAMISAIIANQLPGSGSIYKNQSLKFLQPVYHGESLLCEVEIIELIENKKHVRLLTQVFKIINNEKVLVLDGEAFIKKIDI